MGLALVAVAVVGTFTLMRGCERSVERAAAAVSRVFSEALSVRPQLVVNARTIYTQTSPVAELAVVTKDQWLECALHQSMQILRRSIPLTEKKITARAAYRIKAGFDLRKPFLARLDPKTGRVWAQLPPAQILSLERISPLEFEDTPGVLNSITNEDRQRVLAELDLLARRAAENSGILQDAQTQAVTRLEELARRNGLAPFSVIWGAELPEGRAAASAVAR